MRAILSKLTIRGFRSIRDLSEFDLTKLNVLVGPNGAGKSNFVDFFRLLRAMYEEGLQRFVRENGGADSFCFEGPKITYEISAHLEFGQNAYKFKLAALPTDEMFIAEESTCYRPYKNWNVFKGPRNESFLGQWVGQSSKNWTGYPSQQGFVASAIRSWVVYHFHDTSKTAPMRRTHALANYRELQPDAGNIAPFLRSMREENPQHYMRICDMIRQVAPFFDTFILDAAKSGEHETTRLEWKQKGSSFPYQAWQLSDGTIRFICLATALLQPHLPSTFVIDEPELGLHPFALSLLAALIHEASEKTQVIVSTQSPTLLNHFEPEHVVVVDRADGASRFQRLDANSLAGWLEDYTLGELLQKNVIEASPRYEF